MLVESASVALNVKYSAEFSHTSTLISCATGFVSPLPMRISTVAYFDCNGRSFGPVYPSHVKYTNLSSPIMFGYGA